MPRTRLELAHPNGNQPLKLACLPIPPSGQYVKVLYKLNFLKNIQSLKPAVKFYKRLVCAQNRARTCTSLLILVPETSASTSLPVGRQVSPSGLYSGCKVNKKIILLPHSSAKFIVDTAQCKFAVCYRFAFT